MKIHKIKFRNVGSYGNAPAEIDLTGKPSGLHLITGQNGAGKCVDGSTMIDVRMDDPDLYRSFMEWVATTGDSTNRVKNNYFLTED